MELLNSTKASQKDLDTKIYQAAKIHEAAKDQLGIEHSGTVYTTFLIEHSAPLITPDTAIYKELKSGIFGE